MDNVPPPRRCVVCGAPIGDRPIWLAAAPSGRDAWAIHLYVRDCIQATVAPPIRPLRKEARHATT